MPVYGWMIDKPIDTTLTPKMIRVMQKIGVPYEEGYDKVANRDLMLQAQAITDNLAKDNLETHPTSEVVALIAYLQRLGTDIKKEALTDAD